MSPPRHHPRHRRRFRRSGDRPAQGLASAMGAVLVALVMLTGSLAQPTHLASAHAGESHHHHHHHSQHDHGSHDERQPASPTSGDDCLLCHLILTAQGPLSLASQWVEAPSLLDTAPAAAAEVISLTPLRNTRGRAPPATA